MTAEAVAALKQEIAELRADLDRLRDRVYDCEPTLEIDRIVVPGRLGVVEIGEIGEHMFGVRISGRHHCEGLGLTLAVDGGRHSVPAMPLAIVEVSGNGSASISSPQTPAESPRVLLLSSLGDRTELGFRFGGYADGTDSMPADTHGAWASTIAMTELTDYGEATIDVSLLDDLMRAVHGPDRAKWPRSAD